MIIGSNPEDRAYLVKMERRARCAGCGKWIQSGDTAWSYLSNPTDGNYVEHDACRYGTRRIGRSVVMSDGMVVS